MPSPFRKMGIRQNNASSDKRSIRTSILFVVLTLVASMSLPTFASGTASAGATQFVISGGFKRPATGAPIPPSSQEVVLTTTGSSASTNVSGSGRVIISAYGTYCNGWPVAAIYIGGASQGSLTLNKPTKYGTYQAATKLSAGTHTVKLVLTNDRYVAGSCDRNIILATVRIEFPPLPALVKADATSTGVPAGTALTVHQGDITVTRPGTVIDALDVRGSIYVKANDVTIKRSVVRGGPVSKTYNGLIVAWWGYTNLVVQDSKLRADYPSYNLDGLSGSNFTATRLDISRVVDTVGIMAGNASITNSWLHDTVHFSPDPTHSDNQSHNDGIQVHGGKNIVISGNNIQGANNAAIMVGQGKVISDLKIMNNWLSDGACTINVSQGSFGPILRTTIENNKYGPGSYGTDCPMRLPKTSPITVSGNTWAATNTVAKPHWL